MKKMKSVTQIKSFAAFGIILAVIMMIGCSKPIDTPQFQKVLIFSDDHEVSFAFDVDKTWDKGIQSIEALVNEGNVPLDLNEIEDVEQQGRVVRKEITCYLNDNMITQGKKCSFKKILVTWDDGSEQTAEIGDITITGEREENNCKCLILEGSDRQRVQTDKYDAVSLKKNRLLSELKDVYEDILINGESLFDITNVSKVAMKSRTRMEVETLIDTSTCPYSLIDVDLTLICSSKDGEKQYVDLNLVLMRDE